MCCNIFSVKCFIFTEPDWILFLRSVTTARHPFSSKSYLSTSLCITLSFNFVPFLTSSTLPRSFLLSTIVLSTLLCQKDLPFSLFLPSTFFLILPNPSATKNVSTNNALLTLSIYNSSLIMLFIIPWTWFTLSLISFLLVVFYDGIISFWLLFITTFIFANMSFSAAIFFSISRRNPL